MFDFLLAHPYLTGLLVFALLAGLLCGVALLGIWLGRRRRAADEPAAPGSLAIEGSVLALLGLMIAFTFHGAAERFQTRKLLILREAQAVGTAWSRLDLLPDPARERLRGLFRTYLDRKLEAYGEPRDLDTFTRNLAAADEVGGEILRATAAACRTESEKPYAEVLMPAVNEMSDLSLARRAALWNHPPLAIYGLLLGVAGCCAFLVGVAMSRSKKWSSIHLGLFAALVAGTIYMTLELELPRAGAIRVEKADALLRELRRSMDVAPPGPPAS